MKRSLIIALLLIFTVSISFAQEDKTRTEKENGVHTNPDRELRDGAPTTLPEAERATPTPEERQARKQAVLDRQAQYKKYIPITEADRETEAIKQRRKEAFLKRNNKHKKEIEHPSNLTPEEKAAHKKARRAALQKRLDAKKRTVDSPQSTVGKSVDSPQSTVGNGQSAVEKEE